MTSFVVRPAERPLTGSVPVPSDKSIGHRALIFAALAAGESVLRGFSHGEDNVATQRAFAAMGVQFDDDGEGVARCRGVGLDGLRAPRSPLDCGNSGTTMRLLAGVLAGQPFESTLFGDASLSARPMGRVALPLRARGARIEGRPHPTREGDLVAPLVVGPLPAGARLASLEYEQPVSSAQVKSALLLSGLWASGPTLLKEPMISRDHTERMLDSFGLPIERSGSMLRLSPPSDRRCIRPFEIDLPGDLSAAAFLLTAGLVVEGSTVTTRATGLNPTRSGFLDAARDFGGGVAQEPHGDALGEPVGEITARYSDLRATSVGGEVAVRAIDEIPILCALAARARGSSTFSDVEELRVKESDRIAVMVAVLRAFGLEASERPDGLVVEGRPGAPLRAARVQSRGDHRIAMTAAVLGLVADGETIIEDVDVVATSFPRFAGTLRALGANIEVRP